MAKETDQEARLRLFLAEYERVCTRYSLMIYSGCCDEDSVFERFAFDKRDDLPQHIAWLKQDGINV